MASMKVNHLKRREFITLLGGAATWPLRAQAQQPERMRRIGVLMSFDENDPTMKLRVSAFTQALADLGWTDGRKRADRPSLGEVTETTTVGSCYSAKPTVGY